MEVRQTNPSAKSRKRRLLVVVMAFSVGGCATSRDVLQSDLSHTRQVPRAVANSGNVIDAQDDAEHSAPKIASPVETVGYDEELAISSPLRLALQTEGGEVSGTDDHEAVDEASNEATTDEGEAVKNGSDELAEPISMGVASNVHVTQQPVNYFVSTALANHPKIRAARNRVAATSNVIPQARALPDPKFNNTFWPIQDQALQTAGGRVGHQFQLSQGVPWPEKLSAKAAIASREVQMAQAEVQRIEREITESVRLAYYEVWFATRAITIIEETRELVDDLTQVAEARYKSGGTQQDVLRAQLEADRLDDQLVVLRKQKKQAQADLAALLQQPVSLIPETQQDIGLTNVPKQLDELLGLAEQCSPELRALAWEIQRDREKQRLACLQKYPDFNLGLNYSIINDDTNVISPVANGHDNISFVVGVTLPIWREKINAGIREASHRTSSTTQRLEAERDAIQGKLRRLMAQADALVEQEGIYEDRIIPRTEDTLKLSIADYRGKRTDFFTLIETYRELLMFETQLARIEATLAGTIAQIERTVGCPYGGEG
ncbi:putative outer membrane efflux protein MdtP [Stieleria maiorica]|uniref:Putative outer membrane efflux protein MdtP n=1 Tax=Stieleria maiorica TaxID=2795974 RepID=A0A5B9MKQ3_9BACT|nr:TolC family protein [Stieleria maiorica]QEG01494.1 putative outer membrane efflux protein MdtP [Stieleria maiorica]